MEEQRVRVIADFEGLADTAIGLGDRYRADVVLWRGEDVLRIPENSMFDSEDGSAMFVVTDGIAHQRAVGKVGSRCRSATGFTSASASF